MKKPADKKVNPPKGKDSKLAEPEIIESGPHIFEVLSEKVKANIIDEKSI